MWKCLVSIMSLACNTVGAGAGVLVNWCCVKPWDTLPEIPNIHRVCVIRKSSDIVDRRP
jgi:hypothetical protein